MKRYRPLRYFALSYSLVSAMALNPRASATMAVVIRTKDGYWIAADGDRTVKGQKGPDVCKIHASKYGLVVKAGASEGYRATGEDYSTDATVHQILEANSDTVSFMQQTKRQFLDDLTEELVYTVRNQGVTVDNLPSKSFTNPVNRGFELGRRRDLLLLDLQDGSEPIKHLAVTGVSIAHYQMSAGPGYSYASKALFDWTDIDTATDDYAESRGPGGVYMFFSVVDYKRDAAWIQAHPDRAALEILEQGHSEDPISVGPPYTLVHIKFPLKKNSFRGKARVTWVKPGKCPSWMDDNPPDSAKDFFSRN